jgi:hypothetical protein
VSEALRSALSALLADLTADFKNCHDEMELGVTRAGLGSAEVLRRPKADVEIQVGLTSLADVESGTEQPEPKGKGKKGRGGARPPPKRPPQPRKPSPPKKLSRRK